MLIIQNKKVIIEQYDLTDELYLVLIITEPTNDKKNEENEKKVGKNPILCYI